MWFKIQTIRGAERFKKMIRKYNWKNMSANWEVKVSNYQILKREMLGC